MANVLGHSEHASSDKDRLACPFQAHYPKQYKKAGSCRTGLADIPKLIEHLKKHHSPKCPECNSIFHTLVDLYTHRQSTCSRARAEATHHLTEAQLAAITAMPKRSSRVSPGQKWEEIYRTIFTDDSNIPSPYVQTLEHLRRIAETRPSWLVDSLRDTLTSRVEDFLADLPRFLDIVSSGRKPATVEFMPSNHGQPSCESIPNDNEETQETGVELGDAGIISEGYISDYFALEEFK
ncbi:hypothetical protein DL766_009621 [Monosporascus sp. MC13-8B]|uniref:C2H2-type domain-containing protein n=1 Tax=Monosporascus cannonballus TaxID=155416 RepID=A0ABY0HGJ6_9PEZI|nr:hypothetical protein DL763_010526 [Monosporascus cannonballus]RYO92097.1 hypothetical protein DL762_001832 [Monosporascus cannonballus]RYP14615.1 hypothetical protein DL766_009621 [Monosporascus sp. MC13-8B]